MKERGWRCTVRRSTIGCARGVTQILLAGVSTSNGVESTVCSAHEHGYIGTIITDAMTDTNLEAHFYRIERISARRGELTDCV